MPRTTTRLNVLPPYPLAHIPQKKRDLIARGVDVIDLGAGDADLPPPPAAVEALAKAARDPALGRYGFGLGYVPFREAISRWMDRRFKQRFDPLTEIVPLIGSKEGIAHLAFGFLQPGDVAIGLTTSGKSENVISAFVVARAKGAVTVALTGSAGLVGGEADHLIAVPSTDSAHIQEVHLMVLHAWCAAIDEALP